MFTPTLLLDRPRPLQVILGGVVPFAVGAVAGVLLGVAAGAYWAIGVLAAVGGVLAGFEHPNGWGGADRGLVGGALYGTGPKRSGPGASQAPSSCSSSPSPGRAPRSPRATRRGRRRWWTPRDGAGPWLEGRSPSRLRRSVP